MHLVQPATTMLPVLSVLSVSLTTPSTVHDHSLCQLPRFKSVEALEPRPWKLRLYNQEWKLRPGPAHRVEATGETVFFTMFSSVSEEVNISLNVVQ